MLLCRRQGLRTGESGFERSFGLLQESLKNKRGIGIWGNLERRMRVSVDGCIR